MRSILPAAIAAALLLGAESSAIAQRDGADRADRGQRLDSNALRNDMLQDQLKQPTTPQGGGQFAPQSTGSPKAKGKGKKASSKKKQ